MSDKFHINKKGLPSKCKALIRCPLGNSEEHFNSAQEAQDYADKINSGEVQKAPILKKISKSSIEKLFKDINLSESLRIVNEDAFNSFKSLYLSEAKELKIGNVRVRPIQQDLTLDKENSFGDENNAKLVFYNEYEISGLDYSIRLKFPYEVSVVNKEFSHSKSLEGPVFTKAGLGAKSLKSVNIDSIKASSIEENNLKVLYEQSKLRKESNRFSTSKEKFPSFEKWSRENSIETNRQLAVFNSMKEYYEEHRAENFGNSIAHYINNNKKK